MMTALLRLKNILNIYTARTEYLDELNNEKGFCIEGYSTSNLEGLNGVADTSFKDTRQLKFMSSAVSSLKTQNEKLLRASCPLLY
jgi:hypothetical protein